MMVSRQGIQWQDFGTFKCSPILSSHFSRASAPMTFTLTTYTHALLAIFVTFVAIFIN